MPTYLSPGVYMEEVSSGSKPIEGVGTAVAAFVGFAEKGPANTPTLVTNWTQYTQNFGDFVDGAYLAHAVYGYFLNGGGAAYVVRIGSDDSEDAGSAPTAQGELPAGEGKPGLVVKALESGPAGDSISVETQDASEAGENNDQFKLIVKRDNKVEETYDNVTLRKGANNVATRVKAESKLISVEEVRGGGTMELHKGANISLGGGAGLPESVQVSAADYVGDSSDRTGFGGLEAIDEVTMLCVPDLTAALERGMIDMEGFKAVQLAMIAHCELHGRPRRHSRPAAVTERAADQGLARQRGRVRQQVRDVVLAAAEGDGSHEGQGDLRSPVGAHGRRVGAQRRHPRCAQGARQ